MISLLNANSLRIPLADKSVHMVVTSPPYWSLRDYGTATWEGGDAECEHKVREDPHIESSGLAGGKATTGHQREGYKNVCRRCGAVRVDNQLGLERLHDCGGWATGSPCGKCFICHVVAWAREVKRVLRDDGTFWCNLGDSFFGNSNSGGDTPRVGGGKPYRVEGLQRKRAPGLKPKDMCLIPARVALALQADGWYVRSDIIWCISGGAYVYAKTQKGVLPTMVRDLIRLDPSTVQLWNGEKWTQLLGISKSKRRGDEVEIVLRSGERISCTPTHKFPTNRGLIPAGSLAVGDVIQTCQLPDVENPRDCAIDEDAAWFAGLYLAEGSMSEDTIQIAGHSKEAERWERVCKIVNKYGGSCTRTIDGNKMNIRVHGKILNAIIDELVTGHIAKDKGFSPSVWKYSNNFIDAMIDGYLSGDGHYEPDNNRWRLGFTRNYNLERDLRTACARLGYRLTLNLSTVKYNGKDVPTFRGELRKERSGHRNQKDMGEVVEIRKSKCREVYDLGVEDEPHLFSLASGVLTHNSKPNPMPESVTDRPTKSHEYLWLLSKSEKYFYDQEAVREGNADPERTNYAPGKEAYSIGNVHDDSGRERRNDGFQAYKDGKTCIGRNRRSVWTIATQPWSGSHYATFPEKLVEPCIRAGTSERGCCPTCGAGWVRVVDKGFNAHNGTTYSKYPDGWDTEPGAHGTVHRKGRSNGTAAKRLALLRQAARESGNEYVNASTTLGFRPSCSCPPHDPIPCVVLDPFAGSGTTLLVARKLGRSAVGLDLSFDYLHEQARSRLSLDALDEWEHGKRDGASLADLPMFAARE